MERSIIGVVFTKKRYNINVNRIKLEDVHPILLDVMISEIEKIYLPE
ncbi:MAG: hypothetical protein JXL97_12695 [Bacteroidales bacterium]|nr:hypothetical protein [Bacteroidales bacterium]